MSERYGVSFQNSCPCYPEVSLEETLLACHCIQTTVEQYVSDNSQGHHSKSRIGSVRRASTRLSWVHIVPAIPWASNTAYCVRGGSSPIHVMYRRSPGSMLSTLASPLRAQRRLDVLDMQKLRQHVSQLLVAQEELARSPALGTDSLKAPATCCARPLSWNHF